MKVGDVVGERDVEVLVLVDALLHLAAALGSELVIRILQLVLERQLLLHTTIRRFLLLAHILPDFSQNPRYVVLLLIEGGEHYLAFVGLQILLSE